MRCIRVKLGERVRDKSPGIGENHERIWIVLMAFVSLLGNEREVVPERWQIAEREIAEIVDVKLTDLTRGDATTK
jgi:hypothetical protein